MINDRTTLALVSQWINLLELARIRRENGCGEIARSAMDVLRIIRKPYD